MSIVSWYTLFIIIATGKMRVFDLLIICALALLWNAVVPVAGAFYRRRSWRRFRRRFSELRLCPVLDYAAASGALCAGEGRGPGLRGAGAPGDAPSKAAKSPSPESAAKNEYRFIGVFESLQAEGPEGRVLWIRNSGLTVPVVLDGAHTYVLPEHERDPETWDPDRETPQRISWDRLSGFSGGTRVYVGGSVELREDRAVFVSGRENPLLVIIFDGPDETLTARVTRAGRQGNEYWNALTPYALVLGAFSQFVVILAYWQRPAFQLTVYAAIAALCLPLYPLIPPAFLFTLLYRRLWWQARLCRAWRDLVRLPLRYLAGPESRTVLPGGELYGGFYVDLAQQPGAEKTAGGMPVIVPERALRDTPVIAGKRRWYVFGAIRSGAGGPDSPGDPAPGVEGKNSAPGPAPDMVPAAALPGPPKDPLATWGAIPGNPDAIARHFTARAFFLETLSWLILLSGIAVNTVLAILIIIRFAGV
jgi:hypothetical protein